MAYGKKNHVNLNPLSYNIVLLGESKIGKTTLIKKVCEKLAGENGYTFQEIGRERGADAIEGINYINNPKWEMEYDESTNSVGFSDFLKDIIKNKVRDYPDLKVVIWDTYDQLINIAEDQSIYLWNKYCNDRNEPGKKASTINGAWGGYGKGEKKAMELMFQYIDELRNVGVAVIIIGHIKLKDVTDVLSGETYQTLTSDQQQNYFNALKKNIHFLGLAYYDRTIIKEKTGNTIKKGKKEIEETKGKIKKEVRKIKFRDDNYAIDSGSRFADIVSEIDFGVDEFINALKDAIMAEQSKSKQSVSQAKEEQENAEKKREEKIAEEEKKNKEEMELKEIIKKIADFFKENISDRKKISMIMKKCKELNYENPSLITSVDDAKAILELCK